MPFFNPFKQDIFIHILTFYFSAINIAIASESDCLDPASGVPKGSYISQICGDNTEPESCTAVIQYNIDLDYLSIFYTVNEYDYSFIIWHPCDYVHAGNDLKLSMSEQGEEGDNPFIHTFYAVTENKPRESCGDSNIECLALSKEAQTLLSSGAPQDSCKLKYYPTEGNLIGKCKVNDTDDSPIVTSEIADFNELSLFIKYFEGLLEKKWLLDEIINNREKILSSHPEIDTASLSFYEEESENLMLINNEIISFGFNLSDFSQPMNFVIDNSNGFLKIRSCPKHKDLDHCGTTDFHSQLTGAFCKKNGMNKLNIKALGPRFKNGIITGYDRIKESWYKSLWHCHDSNYSKDDMHIDNCTIIHTAFNSKTGALVSTCEEEYLIPRHIVNASACLKYKKNLYIDPAKNQSGCKLRSAEGVKEINFITDEL